MKDETKTTLSRKVVTLTLMIHVKGLKQCTSCIKFSAENFILINDPERVFKQPLNLCFGVCNKIVWS